MAEYLPLFILLALCVVFVFASLVASRLLAPRRPTAAKLAPYECGIVPNREPAQRFPVRFYLIAMIFIIFDIEIIFLYPWAVRFDALGAFGLAEMLVFTLAVVVSLAYMISKGALDWGPPKRGSQVQDPTVSTVLRSVRPAEQAR
jgi:NADH-quinone oxidoreductase subunit A